MSISELGPIQFTEDELSQLPNTISIIRQVGKTHPGLGVRAAFMELIDIANMGCLQTGVVGKPKTEQELRVFKNYLALLGINVDGYQHWNVKK